MIDWSGIYTNMSLSRSFELATAELWDRGLISGEMHLGTGEELVNATLVARLRPDDAVATDHRSSAAFVMRGVDLAALFGELLGDAEGLCGGRGGHMHLFTSEPLTVSSGIVGASAPTSAGFALAARYLRPGSIGVGFFGDGAANQGMLLETMNLAVAWNLPVVFVCKDNDWAITTRSTDVTGGELLDRFHSFGLRTWTVDGADVGRCDEAMQEATEHARQRGPGLVLADVPRLHGHLLGYKAARVADHLTSDEAVEQVTASVRALAGDGASIFARTGGLLTQMKTLLRTRGEHEGGRTDPFQVVRRSAQKHGVDVEAVDTASIRRVNDAMELAIQRMGGTQ